MCVLLFSLALVVAGCGGGGASTPTGNAPDDQPDPDPEPKPQPEPEPEPITTFVVHDDEESFVAPQIVLHHDATNSAGFEWENASSRAETLNNLVFQRDPEMLAWGAANYLQEAINKMCGRSLEVTSSDDISQGIVLLLLDDAPGELQRDAALVDALKDDGSGNYNNVEAYYIRSEEERLLLMANTAAGLINGAVALMESVDYEVLGMGPNWIHVPDASDALIFDIEVSGRPSWYLREPTATSGQYYGVGTIYSPTATPLVSEEDEFVQQSYWRWRVGSRTWGQSMAGFPGHALQARHEAVATAMVEAGSTEGYLAPTQLGLNTDRPAADESNKGTLWINSDATPSPEAGGLYISNGSDWTYYQPAYLPVSLDLTVDLVRETILDNFESSAETWFAAHPDERYIYGTDPEDGGGYANFATLAANPNWYNDYRFALGDPLDQAYRLNGMFGIVKPVESYDQTSVADCVYAFNDWLLREYDQRIAARPESERVTSSGEDKRALVRTSFYCYNYHDVPPGFHPDPRMRVMIAGYPKNRGRGKWSQLANLNNLAAALKLLLPDEPSASYSIWSLSYYQDFGINGVEPIRSSSASAMRPQFTDAYQAGIRGYACETDFNFGKHGITYYLMTKLLWDSSMSVEDLDTLRDRWIQRSFGAGWEPMRDYYNLLSPEAWFANTETLWATAVGYIDTADALIDPSTEPAAQRRLDEVKQLWWYHYLTVEGRVSADDPDLIEYMWKGQSSYQVAMHTIIRRIFGQNFLHLALDAETFDEPAHYTPEETGTWWNIVRNAWETVPVTLFKDVTLADATLGSEVDLNDLVWTDELVAAGERIGIGTDRVFWYNSGYQDTVTILTSVKQGETLGFTQSWTEPVERFPSVGVERWESTSASWEQLVDPLNTTADVAIGHIAFPNTDTWISNYAMVAPMEGTYRIQVGRGGNFTQVTSFGFDFDTYTYDQLRPCTYTKSQDGLTQYAISPNVFIYVPKGVTSLDMELLNDNSGTARIYTRGVMSGEAYTTRDVTLGSRGTMAIPLNADEEGSIVAFSWPGFYFPVLYSVPQLWARSPAALLVPRAVAAADGLTVR